MKRRFLSFALVLLLILSMATLSYAAEVNWRYVVTKTGTYNESYLVSEYSVAHIEGTADTIGYTIHTSRYSFDYNVFPPAYKTNLMGAYHAEGLLGYIDVPTGDGTKTIPATSPTGLYMVELVIRYANGTWSVYKDNSLLSSGVFDSSPMSYSIVVVR